MSVSNRDVAAVQRCYPQIYLACHTRHQRRRASPAALTSQESSILAHLSEREPIRAAAPAGLLGVGPPRLPPASRGWWGWVYTGRGRDAEEGRPGWLGLSQRGGR